MPWYRQNRDIGEPDYCQLRFYDSLEGLRHWSSDIREADAVIVGSYVPEGVEVGKFVQTTATGVRAFYDIDTPVTLAKLERGDFDYLSPELIRGYDLYLSFTGGPTLQLIEDIYGSPRARALYCAADIENHAPVDVQEKWTMGYIGTYSEPILFGTGQVLQGMGKGIHIFRLDEEAGALTPVGVKENVRNPSYLAFDPHRRFLFLVR